MIRSHNQKQRIRPGTRAAHRMAVIGSVLAVLASYAVVGPVTAANAATVTGSNFEIDGNLVVDGAVPVPPDPAPTPIDWLSGGTSSGLRGGVNVKNDLTAAEGDDSFTGGTKNDSATPTVDTGSIPPEKSDLTRFGTYLETTASATYVNVFWTRVQDPNGTTAMDFEFNQSATNSNKWGPNPPNYYPTQKIPTRTAGDLLLTYELAKGGTTPVLSRRTWSGSAWGAATVFDATQALGSINTSAIPANQAGSLGALDARTFGEASINLAALLPDTRTCTTFGSVYVKSRASDVLDEELKDFIAPEAVSISNCGSVKIHKTESLGNGTPTALAGAGFTLYNDVAPLGGSKDVGDTVSAGTCTTDASGDCTISNVFKGDYWLVETTIPAGHDPAADQPVSITSGDQVVNLTLDDPIQTGTITVVKDAVPNDAQDFTFSLTGQPSFSLDDDADATLSNTRSFTVPVGTYSLSETNIPDGWVNTDLVCDDANGSTAKPTATIHLAKNEHVTCTYTDTFTKLGVNLQTQVASAGAGSWNDGASLTGDGTHAVTGSVLFFACAAHSTATACTSDGTQVGGAAPVTHVSGADYAAATTAPYTPADAGWTCFRAEYTSTSAFYADSSHTNATSECFLKQAQNLTVTKTATAAFGRLYTWTINKVVDKAEIDIPAGATATSTYDVTVGNSHVDSAWTVTGNITVHNSNPVAFTGVAVTDAINNGAGDCSVTGGTNVTVPASGTAVLGYTCTYSSAPSPAIGTNTATATWNKATFFTPADSATGTAGVDFSSVTPSVTDEIVDVTDSVHGVLGTLDARTAANPTVFHYTVDRSGIVGTCTDYPNTATFTTNDSKSTGTSSKTVKVCVGSDLTVGTTANGSKARDDLWTITKDVDKTSVNIAAGGQATFNYSVTVTPNGVVDSNYNLTGLVNVTNPNDWEDITANVTEVSNVGGGVSCAVTGGVGVVVPKSGSVSLPYSCTFSGTPAASGTVTATATWNKTTASTPNGSASATAAVSFAIGSETHETVTVVDDKTDPSSPVTLGIRHFADGAHTYTYSVTKDGVAGACTSYTNTASLTETGQHASKTVTVCVGVDLTVTKTALATDHRTFLWDITKNVDQTSRSIAAGGTATFAYTVTATPSGTTDDGWSVSGQIKVTNPNNWESITADITDVVDSGGGANCTVGDGSDVVIPASTTVTLNYVCTFASEPADGTNTATAAWSSESAATPHGSATGTAAVVFLPSSLTNETITVVDDKTDPAHPVTLGTATYGDGPTVFKYTLDKQGTAGQCTDYTNTAVISETEQSASQDITVCVGKALTLASTAGGSFARDDLWSIDKTVDQTAVTVTAGQSATFSYTVTATPGAVSDSGYTLGGTVTVSNPNLWEGIVTDVTVATDLGGGAVCTVTDGTGNTVAADGELTVNYTCTFTDTPALTGTVTATATWDATAASTPVGSAELSTPATLVLGTESHKTLTVIDDKTDPAHPVTLGTATYGDTPTVFTYSLTKTTAAGSNLCTTYTNVATLVETEQSDSQNVQLCGTFTGGGGVPVVTPALPFTGDFSGMLSRWALALLMAGGLLLLLGRRRSTS